MKPQPGRTQRVQEAPIVKLIADSKVPSDVVDLGQGVPFYGPPREAILAATEALDRESGFTKLLLRDGERKLERVMVPSHRHLIQC